MAKSKPAVSDEPVGELVPLEDIPAPAPSVVVLPVEGLAPQRGLVQVVRAEEI